MSTYNIVLLAVILLFGGFCSYQDIKTMKIQDYPLWAASYAALIVHLIFNREGMWIYVLSGMVAGLFYYTIRLITKGKLGIGDVYFGFFQGACLPLIWLPVCIFAEIIITLIVINKNFGRKAFPFVPFMWAGMLISYLLSVFITL